MALSERCKYLWSVFEMLQCTNSTLVKRKIVEDIYPECKEDFQYIVECLTGKHKFGYTYNVTPHLTDRRSENNTVKEVLEFLQEPRLQGDLSEYNIARYVNQTAHLSWFFEPIVNRTLKIGIGSSILPKDGIAPMLAKKYDGKIKYDSKGYFITEKLDGNRCIASYENGKWIFRSRNGKLMHVDFDMGDLPKEFVYDGEVMSRQQTNASVKLHLNIRYGLYNNKVYDNEFNETSGLINRHTLDKDLVYNIFDVMLDDVPYIERREELDKFRGVYETGNDVRILPTIGSAYYRNLNDTVEDLLHRVCAMGGEGIMINLAGASYNHKRTDQLLKFKKVYTMDMKVTGLQEGTGKYEGLVGALQCECVTDDGKIVTASVGSGLSDEQRFKWSINQSDIVGHVVEVAYFSLSQDSKNKGTNLYSLRFPRLKSVREDKNSTSEY